MNILVLNGPNLATLGRREVEIYGKETLADIEKAMMHRAGELQSKIRFFQSNHEGALIDEIESRASETDAIIINPGGLSHTSYPLYDALRAFAKPVLEVHISNIFAREEFRHRSVTGAAAVGVITGLGTSSYLLALEFLTRERGR